MMLDEDDMEGIDENTEVTGLRLEIRGDALVGVYDPTWENETGDTGDHRDPTTNELSLLDDLRHDSEFVQHMDDADSKLVQYGFMKFVYEDGKLFTVTTYKLDGPITHEQADSIADYTTGQWSDGIGECYEQHAVDRSDGNEYYISAWHDKQKMAWKIIDEPVADKGEDPGTKEDAMICIFNLLYWDEEAYAYDPDKEWSGADICEAVANIVRPHFEHLLKDKQGDA